MRARRTDPDKYAAPPVAALSGGGGPAPGGADVELESGAGHIALEDGTGVIELES